MHVLATAGHVDHGKSTLVHALTGMDPDRWAEEKERGLTIDLGFAWTELGDGTEVSLVDVPGHVRFLRNMLAGVGGVDAAVFVVAATEGWKPQSEEHLRILELVGVGHGLVALTKVGLVDEELRELARLDVEEHTAGTFLEGAPIIEVDAPTGEGLPELDRALCELLAATPTAADQQRPRLWVDRAFAARGAGTVVTGTLVGGGVAVEDELELWPGGRPVRLRAIQNRKRAVERLGPGNRAAFNLHGVHHSEVRRGHVLVSPGQWWTTRVVDASLQVLDSLDHEVSRRGAWHLYLGSTELTVALRVLGDHPLAPGDQGLVRLHLPVSLPLAVGDRFLVREMGRDETVGGGELLDLDPRLPASRARPDRSVDRVIAERGVVSVDALELLTGQSRPPTVGDLVLSPAALADGVARVRTAVDEAGALGLDLSTVSELDRLLATTVEGIEIEEGVARPAGAIDPLADHPYPAALAASPFDPPEPTGVDRGELRQLVRRGEVIESEGRYFAPSAVEAAALAIAEMLAGRSHGVTVAEVRDALGTSRKHVLPLLAHLDKTGVTRRRGDQRIGGPRLPELG